MGETCSTYGEMRSEYSFLVGKPEGKKPPGRTKCRLKDNIRKDLRETGREGVGWIHLSQDRDHWWPLVNTILNLQVP